MLTLPSNAYHIDISADHMGFACGQRNPSGLKLLFHTNDEKYMYTTFTPNEYHTGWGNLMHGGLTSTLLDETFGWLVMYYSQKMCVTRNLSVQYIRPIQLHTPLIVSTHTESIQGKYYNTYGEIFQKGQLCASATGNFKILTLRQVHYLKLMSLEDAQKVQNTLNHIQHKHG